MHIVSIFQQCVHPWGTKYAMFYKYNLLHYMHFIEQNNTLRVIEIQNSARSF